MATADVRDIVMVAGKDPYAYKGIDQSIFFSHVRPQKEGGCRWPTEEDRRAAEAAHGNGAAMGNATAAG